MPNNSSDGAHSPYRPVDWAVIVYNLGLAVLWLFGWSRAGFAPFLVLAHLAAAAIPFIFTRLDWQSSSWIAFVRQLYPIALVALYWTEVGAIRSTFHGPAFDAIVLDAERAVFGVLVHEIWLPSMPYLWLGEVMQFLYLMYYPLVFLTPIVLVLRRKDEASRDVVLNVFLVYVVCYISFALFPIEGPRFTMTAFEGPHTAGLLHKFAESLHAGGDQTGAAFPSTHVAASTIVALLAWRWFSRPVALVFAVGGLGVAVSSVFLQNHYLADSLVGIVVGFVTLYVITPLWLRVTGSSRSASVS
jgi:membrane-associated phospholipid phosphatase